MPRSRARLNWQPRSSPKCRLHLLLQQLPSQKVTMAAVTLRLNQLVALEVGITCGYNSLFFYGTNIRHHTQLQWMSLPTAPIFVITYDSRGHLHLWLWDRLHLRLQWPPSLTKSSPHEPAYRPAQFRLQQQHQPSLDLMFRHYFSFQLHKTRPRYISGKFMWPRTMLGNSWPDLWSSVSCKPRTKKLANRHLVNIFDITEYTYTLNGKQSRKPKMFLMSPTL